MNAPLPVLAPEERQRSRALLRAMVWPHRGRIATAMALNGLHGFAITYQTLVVKYVLDVFAAPGLSDADRWRQLAVIIGLYLLASIIGRMLVWHLGFRIFRHVTEAAMRDMRSRFFRHVNQLCPRFHARYNSGELYSYLFGTPINDVLNFTGTLATSAVGAVCTLVATLVWVSGWDWVSAAVLYAAVLASVLTMRRSRKAIRAMTRDYQQTEAAVSGRVADLLRGTRAVKVHGVEEAVSRGFDAEAETIGRKSYELSIRRHYLQMTGETVSYLSFAVLCVALAWRYLGGHVQVPEVAAYIAAFLAMQGPLQICFQASAQWGSAQVSLDRIATVLAAATTTPDPSVETAVPPPRSGALSFDRVTFAYDVAAGAVLTDVVFTIPDGQRVALVGPSGAGKSTITQLLLRLYDPDQGAVRIGDTDLRRVRGSDLRRAFGVVPQDPFMFRATIRENLLVVVGQADDAAIETACRRANAWEFIARAPQGLDTPVGEGGWTLSGGQRQRLAIARVLLANPGFLIFDEATSALDTLSERLIQQTLEREFAGRTAIFIAHRLATVKGCDRILVIDQGRIVQDGSYGDLVARPGMFRDLVRGQQLLESGAPVEAVGAA